MLSQASTPFGVVRWTSAAGVPVGCAAPAVAVTGGATVVAVPVESALTLRATHATIKPVPAVPVSAMKRRRERRRRSGALEACSSDMVIPSLMRCRDRLDRLDDAVVGAAAAEM